MKASKTISANNFRMPKEQAVLFISLSILILLIMFILAIDPLILLVLIGLSAIIVKIKQKQLIGTSVKVTPNSFPDIYSAAQIAAERLSIKLPDIFVKFDPHINAFALGLLGKKSIVLHSSLVEVMDEEELIYVIGHELSHVKCGHTSWLVVTNSVGSVRIPIISTILEYIFLFWNRITEYTADRGGLIANRDIKPATSALVKLATGGKLSGKVNPEIFKEQVRNDGHIAGMAEVLLTHPYIVNRIKNLSIFFESENYKNISKGDYENIESTGYELNKLLKKMRNDLSGKSLDSKFKIIKESLGGIFKSDKQPSNGKKDDSSEPQTKPNSVIGEAIDEPEDQGYNGEIKTKNKEKNCSENKIIGDKDLLKATIDEKMELVKDLLEKGANPNAADIQGDTILHISIMLENYELTKIILEHGASVDQPNKKGETPISIAQANNLTKFSNILKKTPQMKMKQ